MEIKILKLLTLFLFLVLFQTIHAQRNNLMGEWEVYENGKSIKALTINNMDRGIYIDSLLLEGTDDALPTKGLCGAYYWDGAYYLQVIRKNRLYTSNDSYMVFELAKGGKLEFKKKKLSLSETMNSARTNVKHLIGEWGFKIGGQTKSVSIMAGAANDILMYDGTELYDLNQTQKSFPETYEGYERANQEFISFVITSNDEMTITLGGNDLKATRIGATIAKTTTGTSGANNNVTSGVNAKNAAGNTALHEAAKSGDNTKLKELIDYGADVNLRNNSGKTALDIAVNSGKGETVGFLLQNGANVENTHVDISIQKKKKNILKKLLNNGGNKQQALRKVVDKGDFELFTFLFTSYPGLRASDEMFQKSMTKGNYAMAEMMLSKGVDKNKALQISMDAGNTDMVYSCLTAGASANKAMEYGIKKKDKELVGTAIQEFKADASKGLLQAVTNKDKEMTALLLDNNADANKGLKKAVEDNNIEITNLLLNKGANPNSEILFAAQAGFEEIVKSMLAKKADPNIGSKNAGKITKNSIAEAFMSAGADPNPFLVVACKRSESTLLETSLLAGANPQAGLEIVVANKNTGLVKMLLDNGADGTAPQYIQKSCGNGDEATTALLLGAGANPNDGIAAAVKGNSPIIVDKLIQSGADGSGNSLIAASVKFNSTQLTSLLLNAGADANAGIEPAIATNADKVVSLLIQSGADAMKPKYLVTAVNNKFTKTAEVLITNGLDVKAVKDESKGFALIHIAALNNDAPTTRLLIGKGADVNAKTTTTHDSALHLVGSVSKKKRGLEVADLLIQAGADVNAKNNKGTLVFKATKSKKVRKLLKSNNAQTK